jgi:hypothetical protein
MFNVAHVLSPAMVTALATHFKDLNPKPLGGAPKELVAAGKKIYEEGLPESNVQRWPDEFGQRHKWSFCLSTARMAVEQERQ